MRLYKVGVPVCTCAPLCAFSCISARFSLPQWPAKRHNFAQNSAKCAEIAFMRSPL